MSITVYLLLFISSTIPSIIMTLLELRKKNNYFRLYNLGIQNENSGNYQLALHNYEGALSETLKLSTGKGFRDKIIQKIKILHTTINYEKNFSNSPAE
jgi:hypothetical protein